MWDFQPAEGGVVRIWGAIFLVASLWLLPAPAAAEQGKGVAGDYRHRLQPTPHGWPRRRQWCVWIEPVAATGPAARWDQAWLKAVEAALASWAELVPISRAGSPEQAQVKLLRRRPPLQRGRASHGRAELELASVQRGGETLLEPRVRVSISPGQRAEAIQATALHELGHAFGLWGHSDQPHDAMAAVPGPTPILALTGRDRATFLWLQQQPGLGGKEGTADPGQAPCGP